MSLTRIDKKKRKTLNMCLAAQTVSSRKDAILTSVSNVDWFRKGSRKRERERERVEDGRKEKVKKGKMGKSTTKKKEIEIWSELVCVWRK